jgi:hypothetical protein
LRKRPCSGKPQTRSSAASCFNFPAAYHWRQESSSTYTHNSHHGLSSKERVPHSSAPIACISIHAHQHPHTTIQHHSPHSRRHGQERCFCLSNSRLLQHALLQPPLPRRSSRLYRSLPHRPRKDGKSRRRPARRIRKRLPHPP